MMTCVGFAFLYVSMTCKPVATPPSDTYCSIARPIQWHKSDSRKTKEQADTHNRKYKRLCVGVKK